MSAIPLLAVLLALATPLTARAQAESAEPTPRAVRERDEEAARLAFEEGERLLHAGRFADGRDRLVVSLELFAHASTAFNLALAYRGTGQATAGIRLVAALLDGTYGELAPPDRAAAATLLDELRAMTSTLRLESRDDVVVEVAIDARDELRLEPRGSATLRLDVGDHVLRARAVGRLPFERAIRLAAHASETVSLSLAPLPERENETPLHIGLVIGGISLVAVVVASVAYLAATTEPEPLRDSVFGVVLLP